MKDAQESSVIKVGSSLSRRYKNWIGKTGKEVGRCLSSRLGDLVETERYTSTSIIVSFRLYPRHTTFIDTSSLESVREGLNNTLDSLEIILGECRALERVSRNSQLIYIESYEDVSERNKRDIESINNFLSWESSGFPEPFIKQPES